MTVTAVNLGSEINDILVSYEAELVMPNTASGEQLGSLVNGTLVRLEPSSCRLSVPHTELVCSTAEGAGAGFAWEVVVAG